MESLKDRIAKKILEIKADKRKAIEQFAKTAATLKELNDNLIKNNIVSEEEILQILANEYKLQYIDLERMSLSPDNKNLIKKDIALRYRVVPVGKEEDKLILASANPLDVVVMDDLRISTAFRNIELVLAKDAAILKILNNFYSEKASPLFLKEEDKDAVKEVTSGEEIGLENMIKESKLPPIVRVVDLIIYQGLTRRASDIHIEPGEKDLSVRYRVDGVLHQELSLPKKNQSAILARLKIMSSLNITEFRVPQDGRFKVKFEGKEIDFRVSSLPTNFGEKIVLRILDKQSLAVGVKNLGFSPVPLKLFEDALASPFGIILVTGPTGSGKSTTLYSIISQVNTPEKNIITIEDPVEYQMEGITQIPVRAEIKLTFASCLRSVLRQSPDIIMIGEIRDAETADIAIKASLTGEFIFSTLHTNNSVGAITRLIDMGIEPFLVASSLLATTAQRLVRRLCPKCKATDKPDAKLLHRIGFIGNPEGLFKPQGCSYCNNRGYRGRTALLEILSLDDTIREMIIKRKSEEEITEYARAKRSFMSLREDGFNKCLEGITTIEEVLRVA